MNRKPIRSTRDLTTKELATIKQLPFCNTLQELSEACNVKSKTIQARLTSIYAKTGTRNMLELFKHFYFRGPNGTKGLELLSMEAQRPE